MHLLVLCHEFPPIGGGAASICAALARHYARVGHRVRAVTMGYADLPEHESIDGYDLIRIPCGRHRRETASPVEGLRWAHSAWKLVLDLQHRQRFDATHAHFIMPAGIVAGRLKRSAAVPFILTAHGSDVPGYNRERLKLAHVLARPWWRRTCVQADRITTASHSLLDLLDAASSGHRELVIPNGLDEGAFKPLPKEKRILLCSRLVERKGFHTFLEAIADLDLPGWCVDVVGDGPMFERLRRMAARCRVPVRMHGWISNDDPQLAELYGRAMIFVFPSEWENFSVALLEGMSSGCAVITTRIAGNPEVIGDTGCLVAPRDVSGLREALSALTSDPDRCQQLGRCAAERIAASFNWKAIAGRYLEVLGSFTGQMSRCETG